MKRMIMLLTVLAIAGIVIAYLDDANKSREIFILLISILASFLVWIISVFKNRGDLFEAHGVQDILPPIIAVGCNIICAVSVVSIFFSTGKDIQCLTLMAAIWAVLNIVGSLFENINAKA